MYFTKNGKFDLIIKKLKNYIFNWKGLLKQYFIKLRYKFFIIIIKK
jgi:hypothetical protein